MPYFRATKLSPAFLEICCSSSLREQFCEDTTAYRITVISSRSRARSLLFLVYGADGKSGFLKPDWFSTEVTQSISEELKLDALGYVCVYDSFDKQFHATDVKHQISTRMAGMIGILGWRDLRGQFDLAGTTPSGNVVFFAKEGSKCLPINLHDQSLPNSED